MTAPPALSAITLGDAVRRARDTLAAAGIDTPDLDARILVGHAAGLDRGAMIAASRSELDAATGAEIDRLIGRRAQGEPVGRILGRREFWGLEFELGPDTLEPRPDTETLVEAALARIDGGTGPSGGAGRKGTAGRSGGAGRSAPLRVADLGTGSGCILIALLHELPNAVGLGVDLSEGAIRVARANAGTCGVSGRAGFLVGSWTAALAQAGSERGFDVIFSNPPYIESAHRQTLSREVAGHDPWLGLDGGPDGLAAYREILLDAKRVLAPGGAVILELGLGQREAVGELAAAAGFAIEGVRRDLAGLERALILS